MPRSTASLLALAAFAAVAALAAAQREPGLHEACPCRGDPVETFESNRHENVVRAKVLEVQGRRARLRVLFIFRGCELQSQEEFWVLTKSKCRLNWGKGKSYLLFLVRKNDQWIVGQRCVGNRHWRDVGPAQREFLDQHLEATCQGDRVERTTTTPAPTDEPRVEPDGNPNIPSLPASMTRGVDLKVDVDRLAWHLEVENKNFRSNDCAVREKCTLPGNRKLLRFTVGVMNVGTRDLYLGRLQDNPFRNMFEYDSCHRHWHFIGFSNYQLMSTNSNNHFDGHKQSFCLTDSARNPGDNRPRTGYTCANQGISAGWMDVYGANLDCQWVDITGMQQAGKYRLIVDLDPWNLLREENRRNNRGEICVYVDPNRNNAFEVPC